MKTVNKRKRNIKRRRKRIRRKIITLTLFIVMIVVAEIKIKELIFSESYIGKKVYYSQNDPRWGNIPYYEGEDIISTSGCGITAMAIVLSSIKKSTVTPPELANYAIENGYCEGYTKRSFFNSVIEEEEYSLNVENYSNWQYSEVEELLADGNHMAIAIMNPGHFTREGHYIVLYGTEIIEGEKYFKVLDPNDTNDNYGTDGQVIYEENTPGYVKANENILINECDEYWVYSK